MWTPASSGPRSTGPAACPSWSSGSSPRQLRCGGAGAPVSRGNASCARVYRRCGFNDLLPATETDAPYFVRGEVLRWCESAVLSGCSFVVLNRHTTTSGREPLRCGWERVQKRPNSDGRGASSADVWRCRPNSADTARFLHYLGRHAGTSSTHPGAIAWVCLFVCVRERSRRRSKI